MPAGWEPDAGIHAQSLRCPGCGSSLTIHAQGYSETLACGTCGSIIDLTDQNLRILSRFKAQIRHEPLIPLGTCGTLKDTSYQIIGYLRRCVTVEEVDYEWSEYLLFQREQGFRWLVEYGGHWSLVHILTEPPLITGYGAKARATYQGQGYQHFQTANARVSYVLGEFYWRVQVGEHHKVSDYIAPPFQLSQERTDREIVWSQAEYMEPSAIETAFQRQAPLPLRTGIAPNQPSPYVMQWPKLRRSLGFFLVLLAIVQIITLLLSADRRVHQQTFIFDKTTRNKTLSTEAFTINGRESNLLIRIQTALDNNWLYLDLALIDRQSGANTAIGREVSYYHGIDDGEPWSEGDASDEAILSGIPAGVYYLTVEGELPRSSPAVACTLTVFRDVPSWSNFFLALLALLALPVLSLWRARAFERARWAESDHG